MRFPRPVALLAAAVTLAGCSDTLVRNDATALRGPRTNVVPLSGPIDNPYGLNVGTFGLGVEEPDPAHSTAYTNASRLSQAGIGWVRLDFYWPTIQSGGRYSFDAHREDYQVQRARDNGLRVLGTLSSVPNWEGSAWLTDATAWQTFLDDWERYVQWVVTRYPDVTHWSIWNEPNDPGFWPGTEAQYIQLIQRAAPIIRGAGSKVVAPESAHSGDYLGFIGRVLNAAGNDVDVVSVHRYGNDVSVLEHEMYRVAIETPVNVAWRWPIWLTEFGPLDTGSHSDLDPNRIDDSFQATHLQQTMNAMAGARIPFWERTFYWHMVDEWAYNPDGSLAYVLDRGLFAGEREGRIQRDPALVTPRAAYYQYQSEAQSRFAGPSIGYRAHVANNGWHPEVWNGRAAGMVAQTMTVNAATPEIQAMQIRLNNLPGVGVSYELTLRGHGTSTGADGAMAGTTGQNIPVEGIRIWLTAPPAGRRVCYRVQRTDGAWQPEVCDGALAGMVGGTSGIHPSIMAIQIWLRATPGPSTCTSGSFGLVCKE